MIGQIKYLSDCEPGELVRVPLRDKSLYGFACTDMTTKNVGGVILLTGNDAFRPFWFGGQQDVFQYGSFEIIENLLNEPAISKSNLFTKGKIIMGVMPDESLISALMITLEGQPRYYDLSSGSIINNFGRFVALVEEWSLRIKRDQNYTEVFNYREADEGTPAAA